MTTPIRSVIVRGVSVIGLIALASACGNSDSKGSEPGVGSPTRAPSEIATVATEPTVATPEPTISLGSDSVMFCEALAERRDPGVATPERPGTQAVPVATVPDDVSVIYRAGTCEPDLDASGLVAVRGRDGAISRVAPTFDQYVFSVLDRVVWEPATASLNGVTTVMTGRLIRTDASIRQGVLGSPELLLNMTTEGQEVFGAVSERNIGLPLALFVDGTITRLKSGQPFGPTIDSRIEDSILMAGLSPADAARIEAIINAGPDRR